MNFIKEAFEVVKKYPKESAILFVAQVVLFFIVAEMI